MSKPTVPTKPKDGRPATCGDFGGRRKDGSLCGKPAIGGTRRCDMHAGKSLAKAKAEGAVVLELRRWGLDGHTEHVDPGEVLLRLVTQSAARVEFYGRLLGQAFEAAEQTSQGHDDDGTAARDLHRALVAGGVAALIGYRYAADRAGDLYPVEEVIRGLARLEAEERDRCANFAAKAVAAGIAERQVRLAERQGALVAGVFRRAIEAAGLSSEVRARLESALVAEIRAVMGGHVMGELAPAK